MEKEKDEEMNTPKYIHDCDNCKYHDQMTNPINNELYDVWSHAHGRDWDFTKEIILRYGDEGHEYKCVSLDTLSRSFKEIPVEYEIALKMIGWKINK
jgi:hypothetical protein